jgi:hypothetical protein
VGPVFLFDVGIIVFVVSSASGELEGLFSLGKVSKEVVIEKLGSVVTIEAEQGEGQGSFDIFDLFQDVGFSFTPDGTLFGPSGGDVDAVKRIGERAREGFSAMGDGIGFEEAGAGLVPLVGLDGDVFSEERSGFRGGSASFLILDTDGAQESIEGGCRDAV